MAETIQDSLLKTLSNPKKVLGEGGLYVAYDYAPEGERGQHYTLRVAKGTDRHRDEERNAYLDITHDSQGQITRIAPTPHFKETLEASSGLTPVPLLFAGENMAQMLMGIVPIAGQPRPAFDADGLEDERSTMLDPAILSLHPQVEGASLAQMATQYARAFAAEHPKPNGMSREEYAYHTDMAAQTRLMGELLRMERAQGSITKLYQQVANYGWEQVGDQPSYDLQPANLILTPEGRIQPIDQVGWTGQFYQDSPTYRPQSRQQAARHANTGISALSDALLGAANDLTITRERQGYDDDPFELHSSFEATYKAMRDVHQDAAMELIHTLAQTPRPDESKPPQGAPHFTKVENTQAIALQQPLHALTTRLSQLHTQATQGR